MPKTIKLESHLSSEELEYRYRKAHDPVLRSHYQIISGSHEDREENRLGSHYRSRHLAQEQRSQHDRPERGPEPPAGRATLTVFPALRGCSAQHTGQVPSRPSSMMSGPASGACPVSGPSRASPRSSYQVSNP